MGELPDRSSVSTAMAPDSPRPSLTDLALAVGLAGFGGLLLTLPYQDRGPSLPPAAVTLAVVWAATLPLAFRRRYPAAVLVVVGIAYAVYVRLGTFENSVPSLAFYIALFSAGAYMPDVWRNRVRFIVVLGFLTAIAIYIVADRQQLGSRFPLLLLTAIPFEAALDLGAWLMGDWHRERALYERELDRRAQQLERERMERERRVVKDERVSIARELHDVVAHHVSLMGIQAGAARTVLPESPSRAVEMLGAIEASSRRAVEELHRLLGALREESNDRPMGQVPRLRQLEDLIESSRDAGLEPSLEVRGSPPAALPETLDLSAYRIIQEALTNVVKHARAKRVSIQVTFSPTAIDLRVSDDGVGDTATAIGSGRGLIGMRERAALFGGTLRAAAQPGGGFAVDAHLPIPS